MKKDLVYIAIILVMCFFLYKEYNKPVKTIQVPIRIEVPIPVVEKHYDTIFKPSPIKEVVDSNYYKLYVSLLDSIKRDSLVKDVMTVREYNQVYDDSVQTINVFTEVLGRLNKQHLTYKTKERSVAVDTIIPIQIPYRNRFGISAETSLNKGFVFKAGVDYDMKNIILKLSADTDERVWFGGAYKF